MFDINIAFLTLLKFQLLLWSLKANIMNIKFHYFILLLLILL